MRLTDQIQAAHTAAHRLRARFQTATRPADRAEMARQLAHAHHELGRLYHHVEEELDDPPDGPGPGPDQCPVCGVTTGDGFLCSDCVRNGYRN